jgi:hypothetical protein
MLALLTRAFHIELADPKAVRPKALVTTQPEDPPLFRLSCRTPFARIAEKAVFRQPQPADK